MKEREDIDLRLEGEKRDKLADWVEKLRNAKKGKE